MRRFCKLILMIGISVIPVGSLARDTDDKVLDPSAYPSTGLLYQSCQKALKEKQPLLFMQSDCGMFMQGMLAGASLGRKADKNIVSVQDRNCAMTPAKKSKNPSTQVIEGVTLVAQRFVRAYEGFQGSADPFLNNRVAQVPAATGLAMMHYYSGDDVFCVVGG